MLKNIPAGFLRLALFSAVVLYAAAAAAAPLDDTCDTTIMKAMQSKGQAQTAYDVAVMDQIITKPDSALATTCFNKQASRTAVEGAKIFSNRNIDSSGTITYDNFIPQLSPVIQPSLEEFLDTSKAAFGNALGFELNLSAYTGGSAVTAAAADYPITASASDPQPCSGMQDLWNAVKDSGVDQDVPYQTFDDLLAGTVTGSGTDMTGSLSAASTQGTFSGFTTDYNNTQPSLPTYGTFMNPTLFTANTACDALKAADPTVTCP